MKLKLKIKKHLTNAFLMPVKPFATATGTVRECIDLGGERFTYCGLINNNNSTMIKLGEIIMNILCQLYTLYGDRVPAANTPGCTAAEGLLYKPWFLVVPTFTARCLHQRS